MTGKQMERDHMGKFGPMWNDKRRFWKMCCKVQIGSNRFGKGPNCRTLWLWY